MMLTQEEIEEAKAWILDCQWLDIHSEDDLDDLSNEEIEKGIDKHFDGGIEQFKRNCL
ncbi:MAG: hypothetical protein ACKO2V_17485 [Snowella sp.]|jgi:hypothetical protein